MEKLKREFYKRDTRIVAKELLGKYLVHRIEDEDLISKIVEVEAYMGPDDKAAHSYNGRRTARNEIMYGEAGHAYVFIIYGMYYCMNVVTETPEIPRAVLIRALEPIAGVNKMKLLRYGDEDLDLTKKQTLNLTNGPGKLSIAMGITKTHNGEDLCGNNMYIATDEVEAKIEIVESKRINIEYAEEYREHLWRYYIKDNRFVSVK